MNSNMIKRVQQMQRDMKKAEEEIAKRYGCCRASINKHKRAAVQKIEEQAKRLNILNI